MFDHIFNMPIAQNFSKSITPARAFLFTLIILISVNLVQSIQDIIKTLQKREDRQFFFYGNQFRGLEGFFQNVKYVGYYTDKSLDVNQNAAQFAQAQYILAPAILDLNNTNHEYTIFDCSSEQAAFDKIKKIGARPLKKKFGLILARRPEVKPSL